MVSGTIQLFPLRWDIQRCEASAVYDLLFLFFCFFFRGLDVVERFLSSFPVTFTFTNAIISGLIIHVCLSRTT